MTPIPYWTAVFLKDWILADKGARWKIVRLRANKIGSECFRLWKAADAQVGDDFHINPEEIESKYFGILTKIYNVARFASQFPIEVRNLV